MQGLQLFRPPLPQGKPPSYKRYWRVIKEEEKRWTRLEGPAKSGQRLMTRINQLQPPLITYLIQSRTSIRLERTRQTQRVVLFSFPNSVSKNKPKLKLCPQKLSPVSLLITILSLQITGHEIIQCGEYTSGYCGCTHACVDRREIHPFYHLRYNACWSPATVTVDVFDATPLFSEWYRPHKIPVTPK